MAGTYHLPSDSSRVTSSFDDHTDRTPPSTQPGTDYGVNYGLACYVPSDGTVSEVRTNAGPTTDGQGRYVSVTFDDGREARALHLSRVDVKKGQRVTRGQKVGLTGASGYGSDYYYGPHVHQTLWKGRAFSTPEIDFELYVGGPPAGGDNEEDEDEMGLKGAYFTRSADGVVENILFNEVSGYWHSFTVGGGGSYNNAIASAWATGPWASLTESHAKVLKSTLDAVRNGAGKTVASATADAGGGPRG